MQKKGTIKLLFGIINSLYSHARISGRAHSVSSLFALLVIPLFILLVSATFSFSGVKTPIRSWMIIDGFGHYDLVNRPKDPHGSNGFMMDLLFRTAYPSDTILDTSISYRNELTVDEKGRKNTARWGKKTAAVMDNTIMPRDNEKVGVSFFSAWVKSPVDMVVTATFPAYEPKVKGDISIFGATQIVWVNGLLLEHEQVSGDTPYHWCPRQGQEVYLRAGWNFIYARVATWWSGARFGMVLESKENESAKLEIKAEPPLGFNRKLDLQKFAYLAGAGDGSALAQEKQKRIEAEAADLDPATCTDEKPVEFGVDVPLDQVALTVPTGGQGK